MVRSCAVSHYFEYCTWRSPDFECNFEWKRSHSAVKKITCKPADFSSRIR